MYELIIKNIRESVKSFRPDLRLQAADALEQAEDRIEQLEAALKTSVVALDDWLNTYASELCNEDRVKEAQERIMQRDTLADDRCTSYTYPK